MRRGGAIVAGAVALALVGAPSASAVPGDLTYQGCITGQTESGPGGSDACTEISSATAGGEDSGLDRLESVAVSPEGNSVYVAAGSTDDAVARFNRDPVTGAITYVECFSGDTANSACTPIAGATLGGGDSGLNWPESVAVSPDGRSVYLTSRFDHAIAQFSRDPATGALDYIGCDSGEDESVGPCDAIGTPTPSGGQSGFQDPKIKAAVFSADGRFVYAAGAEDDSIAIFDRNTTTGALSFDSCLTGEEEASPPCTDLPDAASGSNNNSGLDQPRWLVIGPDDTSLYAVATNDSAIARFSRNATTGALTFQDCITGDTNAGPGGSGACSEIPSAELDGDDSGLDDARAMVISPDGEFAYAVSGNDDSVLSFDRNPANGALSYLSCMTAERDGAGSGGTGACSDLPTATDFGTDSGFSNMRSMAISGDAVSLYTAAQSDDALATFDVVPATGALTFDRCVTGDTDVDCSAIPSATAGGAASGLDDLETIALSADGRSLYGAAEINDAVSIFDREPVPVPPSGAQPETANCQGDRVTKTNGTNGDDEIVGTGDKDAIFGLRGDDGIRGLGGPDCLDGDSGADGLKGGGGRDRVKGEGGKDKLRGQTGRDRLNGGGGKDDLNGGASSDSLRGGGGKDKLRGGPSRDKLRGNGGGDTIVSGGGKDKINCGGGNDKVVAGPKDNVNDNCERVL